MRIALFLLLTLFPLVGQAEELLIVAHPQVPLNSISSAELASIYMVQKTVWQGGLAVVPVNREASSSVRERFSQVVLEHSPSELANYWNRLRFQGKLPPLVQTSDQAVVGFVRSVPGAIGYVSDGQVLTGVKVLTKLP